MQNRSSETSYKATALILAKDDSGLVRASIVVMVSGWCILKLEPVRFADGFEMYQKGRSEG